MVGLPPRVHRRVHRSGHTQTSHRWRQDDRGKVQCTDTARSQRVYHLLSVTGLGHLIIRIQGGRLCLSPLSIQRTLISGKYQLGRNRPQAKYELITIPPSIAHNSCPRNPALSCVWLLVVRHRQHRSITLPPRARRSRRQHETNATTAAPLPPLTNATAATLPPLPPHIKPPFLASTNLNAPPPKQSNERTTTDPAKSHAQLRPACNPALSCGSFLLVVLPWGRRRTFWLSCVVAGGNRSYRPCNGNNLSNAGGGG
mmetsp:Transcript_48715/g.137066  ORF Transcript_48715/g.137066 Transcript_48715/m.137066 type:complete len:256 (-) Transcript_48715:97-864(-)